MSRHFIIACCLIAGSFCSYGQRNAGDTLYVFVGEKLSIKKLSKPKDTAGAIIISYENYQAKYKIVQSVFGDYTGEKITFKAYDHFGVPAFSKTKYALLFVFKHNGMLHLVNYQYFDVYKTTNGRWASCGNPFYFDDKYKDSVKMPIPVIKLDFPKPVTFKIKPTADSAMIHDVYPTPYFKVEGRIATGLMGSYVEDLFMVKKEGILKQLGFFK